MLSGEVTMAGALPPPGWLFDPYTSQTRWWNGLAWTEHVLPSYETTAYAAALGTFKEPNESGEQRNWPAEHPWPYSSLSCSA